MASVAARFESNRLSHGTAQHENVRCRSKGCKAHLSIAAQLPGDLLPGVATNAAPATELHLELMVHGHDERWHQIGLRAFIENPNTTVGGKLAY